MAQIWTEARRKAKSELMKKRWAENPAYAEKARKALAAGNARRWADPERKEKERERLFYQRCSPTYVNYPRVRLQDPRQAEIHSKLLATLNSDPVLIERRKAAVKQKWADPAYRARMAEKNRRANDKRRGFRVPKEMWAEYRRLTKKKLLPAREAGRILGLI